MKEIKFSIIVPIYNVEKYIKKCIDSLITQSYENFEIIAVNDGSTDKSLAILENIKDERLKIYTKENGGLSSARNYGVDKARGQYIWFLDGDDYIEPESLKVLDEITNKDNSDIVCFKFYNDYISYKIEVKDRIKWGVEEFYPLITVSACTKIYRRVFFIENKFMFKKGVLFEDLELVPDILTSTPNISFCDKYLYNYVQREGSIIRANSTFKTNRDDRFIVLDSLFNRFKEKAKYNKYELQLNYLAIRHLVNIYSEDLFKYGKNIYLSRFEKINNYLNQFSDIDNNKYLKQSPLSCRIYYKLFRKKMYSICKFIINIKKILKK